MVEYYDKSVLMTHKKNLIYSCKTKLKIHTKKVLQIFMFRIFTVLDIKYIFLELLLIKLLYTKYWFFNNNFK